MKTLINALMIGSLLTTAAFAGDAPKTDSKTAAPAKDAKATDAKKDDSKTAAPAKDAKATDAKDAKATDAKDAKKPATK